MLPVIVYLDTFVNVYISSNLQTLLVIIVHIT